MWSLEFKVRDIFSKITYVLLFFSIALTSCSKSESGEEEVIRSSEKRITNFSLQAANNSVLDQNATGAINEESKTINLIVPFGVDLTSLSPSITISDKATITPDRDSSQDFSTPIIFTVTAEDGTRADYTITVVNESSSEKRITDFTLTSNMNPSLTEDIVGTIDQGNRTIQLIVPFSARISSLIPTLVVSDGATANPSGNGTAIDFTSPVTFEITAADDSTVTYTVTTTQNESDYATLRAIFDANPGNALNWDFNNLDINTYTGVTAVNDKVTALNLTAQGLTILPAEIGNLTMLSELYLQNNTIETLPPEIGNLSQTLTQLLLTNNPLQSIPPEIGSLTNLEFLILFNTEISSLPPEIGNLSSLTNLDLSQNFFLASLPAEIGNLSNLEFLSLVNANHPIPVEIGNLTKLKLLNLTQCDLAAFPTQILNLTNLTELFLTLNPDIPSIPAEIGDLTALEQLFLNNNSLSSLPAQIGNLTNLIRLDISFNPMLMGIPQVICDLENNGTVITKDTTTVCN